VPDVDIDKAAEQRLTGFIDLIGGVLQYPQRRENFAQYALGLIGTERKSIEAIAVRNCPDVAKADAAHQRLHDFITDSRWDDRAVRLAAARYALEPMTQVAQIWAWILDDTGFLKRGTHSVGVQRQYTGTAGKITNCQIGVSLTLATPQDHLPVDFELYLPESWAHADDRRAEARIPDEVTFKTKPQLALDMLGRAVAADLPRGTVVADEAYGNSAAFRDGCRQLGLDFAVAVSSATRVWVVDAAGRRRGDPIAARDLAQRLVTDDRFRRYTWREGTSESLSARFAFLRVVPTADDGCEPQHRERLWLICEWRDGEDAPKHFHLATDQRMPFGQLVQLVKERWRTERVYQDLKGELGLDHYQGRRFQGWHHHISVALCCFAFLVAERARAFPPSGTDAAHPDTLGVAA
jgi:SRSO17 transposase